MVENGFHALLTFDKNLQHQQNFQEYTLAIFVLTAVNNTYMELTKLSPKVHEYLSKDSLPAGPIIIAAG
jgi:hypothetical protein